MSLQKASEVECHTSARSMTAGDALHMMVYSPYLTGVSLKASTPCASMMSVKVPVKRPMSRSL